MAQGRKTFQYDLGNKAVSPSEIEPSTVDGEVLQTQAGAATWGSVPSSTGDIEQAKRYAFFVG